ETLSPERNHRTLELYALLIAALALPDLGPGLLEFAVDGLHANLLTDFGPDGVHRERSTHYHLIALRSFVGARKNCRRYGVALPAGFDERLARACEFARDCRRPDGTIPALSDSDTGDYTELLALAARLLDRPDLLETGAGDYPDGGYSIQRAAGERYLILDCGPLGDGGHGHYDALSVEAWDGDRALVLDPGRFTYAEGEPNWRRWFRGTAAHNTVCVDGADQTPYARGGSSLPSAQARLLGRANADGLDVIAAEVRSPVYEAVHRRRVVLVGGAYWIVEDILSGERSHRYDLRWHLAPGPARLWAGGVTTAAVAISVLGARSCALEDGWIAPRYGEREPAPVLSAVAVGRDARFVTLLAPRAVGEPARSLALDGDTVHVGDDAIVLGAWPANVTRRRGAAG
ncbi:MAG TPA: alginate lyase family protein, partial [Solirubrobacter sp.]|nr:alginate lyase family protein [Solirubrobacter sp.]